jgi:hypothetical protein
MANESEITAFKLCGMQGSFLFTIRKGLTVWESAVYSDRCDKVIISRICESTKGGMPFMMGLNQMKRYISPDTIVNLIKHTEV